MHLITVMSCGPNYYEGARFICVPPEMLEVAKSLLIRPTVVESESLYQKLMSVERYFSLYRTGYSPKNKEDAEHEIARFSDYSLSVIYREEAWKQAKLRLTQREAICWMVYTQEPEFTAKYDAGTLPYIAPKRQR